ncbi:hypothetical protein DFS34DRAFT_689539 [Phlyctochytrium arcticum]|nr:hypothetical protein DFS34DRAFT_689539 [Phlyctochytrium arcticum]
MYKLGGKDFASIKAIQKYVSQLITETPFGTFMIGEQYNVLHNLFKCHPNAKGKFGNTEFPKIKREDGGFIFEREDGSRTDISYLKCLKKSLLVHGELTPAEKQMLDYQDICRAARFEIQQQIDQFRREFWNDNKEPTPCPILGLPMTKACSEVDHEITFKHLIDRFLETDIGMTLSIEHIGGFEDNCTHHYFKRKEHSKAWREYHEQNCKLRMVHKTANRGVLRQGIRNEKPSLILR